jgi:hypothetical protein
MRMGAAGVICMHPPACCAWRIANEWSMQLGGMGMRPPPMMMVHRMQVELRGVYTARGCAHHPRPAPTPPAAVRTILAPPRSETNMQS